MRYGSLRVTLCSPILLILVSILSPVFLAAQTPTAPVASDLQAWADGNRNGKLEARELDALAEAVISLLSGPHEARTPLDAMFDANGDKRIGPDELEHARSAFFKEMLFALPRHDPELARLLDLNSDGKIDEREAQVITEYLFIDEKVRPAHKVGDSIIDRRADLNNDGRAGGDEFMAFRGRVVRAVAIMPWSPAGAVAPGTMPGPGSVPGSVPVASEFQAWADGNGNGVLEPPEQEALAVAVINLLSEPHRGTAPVDGMFDANRDGQIGPEELQRARMEYFKPQLMAFSHHKLDAARLVDLNNDGVIDEREAQTVTEYLFLDEKARLPHPTGQSPIERRADMNGDGRAGGDEFMIFRMQIVRAVATLPWPQDATVTSPPKTPTVQQEAPAETATAAAVATTTATTATAKAGDVEITATFSPIFPVFLKYYDDHPIGTAKLKNTGGAAVEKIKVQLIVKEYMTDKKLCTGPDRLEPGEEKEVQLYALFTKSVLDISEATKSQANISVEFAAGGETKTKELVETVSFLNRNNMTWDDDNRVAAFVTANDKSVMLVRSAAVTVVDKASSAVDANLRAAIAVHQLLGLYGMKYWADPKSSYETVTKDATKATAVDYLQFPEQTLTLKTGDCDDLSILESALLEAASVPTAFVTVPGHIYIAFQLKMSAAEAKKSFLKPDDLIFKYDAAWVPLEVTAIKDGFLKAWETGAKEWRESDTRGQAGFWRFEDAKKKYAPVGFSSAASSLSLPTIAALAKAYTDEVKKFISREIATQVSAIQAEIKKDGGKPESVNKLGVLYARYGLSTEAAAEFDRILKTTEYAPALVNAGNIAFLTGDAKAALAYYERALKKEPDRATVLLGIARANHELENYGKVQEAYAKLKTVDSTLAAQFTYLDLRGAEATRAADVGGVSETVIWDSK